jgi:hypothetical protein
VRGACQALIPTSLTHFLPALGVAVAASALALTIAAARLRGREI